MEFLVLGAPWLGFLRQNAPPPKKTTRSASAPPPLCRRWFKVWWCQNQLQDTRQPYMQFCIQIKNVVSTRGRSGIGGAGVTVTFRKRSHVIFVELIQDIVSFRHKENVFYS